MIIKNGLVIDPASGLSEKMDLLIENGIIKEMASLITKEGAEVLDAAGLVVAPGLIDTHVHSVIRDLLIKKPSTPAHLPLQKAVLLP